ncbi:hypothetical protein AX16_004647 [Volvariella volvacea WC 439]|nr:hypothetical protein AX16_004647 [Volvariella volvacea WC 439]
MPVAEDLTLEITEAMSSIQNRTPDALKKPRIGVVHIGFPTVPGHKSDLLFGLLGGVPAVAMLGRFHTYEGYPLSKVIYPIRVLAALGITHLIITNAAGSLNPTIPVGTIVVIRDHLALPNLTGFNPLLGPAQPNRPRFLPLSTAYSPSIRRLVYLAAHKLGIPFSEPLNQRPSSRSKLWQIQRRTYLERMMSRELYESQRGNGATLVKLTKNYRSHSDILKFPNERFYQGELEPCGDKATVEYYLGSSYLPTKSFPIVFHAVHGQDDREASSPSFFNATEVLQVKRYVQKLREDRRFRTSEKDIGIIAPYHVQCLKIRNSPRGVADGIKVGSVEEFQGQERRVIIISTVRSSREFIEYDLKHTLGFVANPRRFNVAVTRAQALLIIVGDPQVLSIDPLWRSFLNYIHNNGGWTGPRITWDPTEPVDEAERYDQRVRNAAELNMNEFTRRMEALTLAEVSNEEDEEDANVDRPWREVE